MTRDELRAWLQDKLIYYQLVPVAYGEGNFIRRADCLLEKFEDYCAEKIRRVQEAA